MLGLEDWMDIRSLHQQGLSVSEIARREGVDRKTVRKYLHEAPREYRRKPKRWKIDPFRVYLRERWEQGVENASRLFRELQKNGYTGVLRRSGPSFNRGGQRDGSVLSCASRQCRVNRLRWTGDISATGPVAGFTALP